LDVNAVPWGEVFIDGQSVGETPLAKLNIPIGPHQIAFRNPNFAEQTRSIVVTVGSASRVGVEFKK
jgi:hypothetical protein